ncbi:MAG: UDP-N-acetylmuramoyl-L-alanyl-D-glutamate--2,6-diaminopimelate ligase [Arenimonas sp.]
MPLHDLLQGQVPALPSINPVVRGMSADSRALKKDDVFIALSGATTHGLKFAKHASEVGVAAVLFESPAPEDFAESDNVIAVPALRRKCGLIASRFYGVPSESLEMIGVTGTNGKTSTVQLIAQALSLQGITAGTIGTLGAGLYGKLVEGERTTPDVIAVHGSLADMRDAGASHVAMEVSSHALDQGRVDAVAFDVVVFTNLTRDHLDYHGSMEAYGEAKAKLFSWPALSAAVINFDDAYSEVLLESLSSDVNLIALSSRGHDDANLQAKSVRLNAGGISFDLCRDEMALPVQSPLLGRFNVDNLLAVAGSLVALDWPLEKIAGVLPKLSPVGGRMSRVGGENGKPLVVVDYAHTPDALEQALANLRSHTEGKLICVFGCGGDRDKGKRPVMAAIAERGADVVIVTDDNPRTENGDAIVLDIQAGFSHLSRALVQRDRAKAIAAAIRQADSTDVVLIAGKGHETYQEVYGIKTPFDDLVQARRNLGEDA